MADLKEKYRALEAEAKELRTKVGKLQKGSAAGGGETNKKAKKNDPEDSDHKRVAFLGFSEASGIL